MYRDVSYAVLDSFGLEQHTFQSFRILGQKTINIFVARMTMTAWVIGDQKLAFVYQKHEHKLKEVTNFYLNQKLFFSGSRERLLVEEVIIIFTFNS